jgi:hypothetical protein
MEPSDHATIRRHYVKFPPQVVNRYADRNDNIRQLDVHEMQMSPPVQPAQDPDRAYA